MVINHWVGILTTSHSDHSLSDYEAFCFEVDHIEEKSSGSTTSHSDLSLPEYESFHFDLSIDPLPPANRSDSHREEFADELAHIISSPEYDCFYFNIEPNPGELTILFEENISEDSTKELTSHELNNVRLLCDSSFSKKFFEIDLLVSFPSGNKDKIFDPGIFIIEGVYSKRSLILPLNDFSTISFISDSLFMTDPSKIKTFLSFPSGNEHKVFDPRILIIDGVFSFRRKSLHLVIDNFMIDKCHILSEISLKNKSSVTFLPKNKGIRGEIPYDREDHRACFQSSNHSVSNHLHIPSGESKVHIKVLSLLWGNRLPIPDGSLPLSRYEVSRRLRGMLSLVDPAGIRVAVLNRKLLKTLSLDESRSLEFNLFSDFKEYSKEEVTETMAKTMEQYMSKTRANYGSGIARPKIDDKDHFKLKGQFLKRITMRGQHLTAVRDLKAFPMSLTGAASRWLRNKPSGSITTWEDLKTKFLSKYCPPARTAKRMESRPHFQQETG
ncbi:reverse transcriptase domain-containing protein [Tanacetum coccineum]